jgi:hypothetical protein
MTVLSHWDYGEGVDYRRIASGLQSSFPVETNFFVAQDTAGMEMQEAGRIIIRRRIGLALLAGCLL